MVKSGNKLWTKDFSIIIVGSFISMLGFAITGTTFGFVVYDQTQSTLLFSLMQVASALPQLVAPVFAGAFFDRRSRRKAIYVIDFIYTAIFGGVTLLMWLVGNVNYVLYLVILLGLGFLNSFYNVAYESYYPNLITAGNYSKAYSISSLLYPIANVVMVPIAGLIYTSVGPVPLFLGATVLFLFTALVETQVKAPEPHLMDLLKRPVNKVSPFERFKRDLSEGIKYLKDEKGLMTITGYFFVTMGTGAVLSTLFLHHIETTFPMASFDIFGKSFELEGEVLYSLIMASNTLGRILGGVFHYRHKFKPSNKYNIALFVYITISFLDGAVLWMPYWWLMCIFQMTSGMLAVTSFNIRISATQNYVPDKVRARFNATFQLITAIGTIAGQLIGGALGEFCDPRVMVSIAQIINLVGIFAIMFRGRKHVRKIYNCDI